jgi:hypothetical protein
LTTPRTGYLRAVGDAVSVPHDGAGPHGPITARHWAVVQYALLTFQDALRRGCGYRWHADDGPPPTQAEVDETNIRLALELNGRVE